ncbi:uncharacterized protein BDZ83DRAFT_653821 [Colletotrichum acutatum]|uniref:Uncharacterized protein n=1 Tax=Glomerella acutata TaxID=27357 RepID=A0AAD8XCF5_GLOAC|nr:uncharacterized protein BDZ83DRAFT_653821 [Colletotrichum acutatum]KAK1722594.1 hypothetical protein BDZ83DRAFT_653821 [Colletotrichum acutatum]
MKPLASVKTPPRGQTPGLREKIEVKPSVGAGIPTSLLEGSSLCVGENFVLHKLESLKYLDVDRLESVGYMRLMYAPKLTYLKLSAFRNITGITHRDGSIDGRSMELGLGGLESLDAFFKEPQLSVDDVIIYNSGKVKRLQIGAAKIGTLKFDYVSYGGPNNLTLVLGGSGITEQTIGSIKTTYSLNGIERLANLKTLSVGGFSSFGANFYQHLDLPFDHLGNLTIRNERELMWLSVPPQAAQWKISVSTSDTTPI